VKFIKCDESWVNFSEIKEIWVGRHHTSEGYVIYQKYGYNTHEYKQLFNTIYSSFSEALDDLEDFMDVHFGDER